MRILIYAMGSAGDVHPFLGLGRALQARGHEVFVATSAFFEELVKRAGLEFRALGTVADFERVQGDPHIWHPRKALASVVKNAVDPSYEAILEIAKELHLPGQTVIVASSLAWGSFAARDLWGIPIVSVHLAPSLFVSEYRQPVLHGAPVPQNAPRWMKRTQWWAAGRVVDFLVLPGLNRFRKSVGLPPARNMLHSWHSPDRVLALFPDWFGPPQPDWPQQTRITGFPMFDEAGIRDLPGDLADFLDGGEAPVIFTPGSAMDRGHSFFDEAVKALQMTGKRGILLSRFPDTIPSHLPEGIRHYPFVPFSQVLPRAAALVYHGGVGTCAQALQAGIPHLLQPMAHDQLDTLSRVRDLCVGDGLHPRQFKAKRIAAMLDRLIGDTALKQRAREIGTRFRVKEWMNESCRVIEEAITKR
ncbi:glycosyltransferase [Luteolibacter sp. GHJ8]|uniref:Glycosyltransferase n=1 Tax=Luteolibacter rhizosphaerae TaxID=2989719 RepID=A0ABT3G456_9BACT|nr:nucleotide disphospho-sugar-binding domain-containing protein [Luteolibacter rhizosphaerae]MCW1914264.1 glycosyltransferase [Luteolibacter rhizosphaerae]